ncbi:MAG TPA: hypothetical protein VLF68_04380 [Candidatus Saccharimonadales bacterium]|nr:hypothetical protein [Candidatus Saccharimonadales bacterium]
MEQAFWTVLAGTLVYALGKIIESLCVQSYISYKKVIGEITYQLIFYAQAYSTRNVKKELHDEAYDRFRKSASRLQAYYNPIEWMHLWFVPSHKDVDDATISLIGLSNNTPPRDSSESRDNAKRVDTIRKKLKIKFYE